MFSPNERVPTVGYDGGARLGPATLEHYIADPESVVAETSMSAPPLRDEQERTDLIAYLALFGPYSP